MYMVLFHTERGTVQSGDRLTPVDLKDIFSTLMFQSLPDRVGVGTSVLSARVPKETSRDVRALLSVW